jgi:large subunit ribosomal protein L25
VLLRLRVRCLPHDLPDQITVDVSALEIGKAIHLGDIKAPAGVEILGNKEVTVYSCVAPLAAEAAPVVEGAAAADGAKQPEMIKEKKTDEAPKADEKKAADKKK